MPFWLKRPAPPRRSGAARRPPMAGDEEVIAEHDKERGTRQKIDEPPTPWASDHSASDDEKKPGGEEDKAGQGADLNCLDPLDLADRLFELATEREEEEGEKLLKAEAEGATSGSGGEDAEATCREVKAAAAERAPEEDANPGQGTKRPQECFTISFDG